MLVHDARSVTNAIVGEWNQKIWVYIWKIDEPELSTIESFVLSGLYGNGARHLQGQRPCQNRHGWVSSQDFQSDSARYFVTDHTTSLSFFFNTRLLLIFYFSEQGLDIGHVLPRELLHVLIWQLRKFPFLAPKYSTGLITPVCVNTPLYLPAWIGIIPAWYAITTLCFLSPISYEQHSFNWSVLKLCILHKLYFQ